MELWCGDEGGLPDILLGLSYKNTLAYYNLYHQSNKVTKTNRIIHSTVTVIQLTSSTSSV